MARLIKKIYENDNSLLDVTNLKKRIFYVDMINKKFDIKPSDCLHIVRIHLVKGEAHISQKNIIGINKIQYKDALNLTINFLRDNNIKTNHVFLEENIIQDYFLSEDGLFITKKEYNELIKQNIKIKSKNNLVSINNYNSEIPKIEFYNKIKSHKNEQFFKLEVSHASQLSKSTICINHNDKEYLSINIELCFNTLYNITNTNCDTNVYTPRIIVANNKKIDALNLNVFVDLRFVNKNIVCLNLEKIPNNVRFLSINKNIYAKKAIEPISIIKSLMTIPNKGIVFDLNIGNNYNLLNALFEIVINLYLKHKENNNINKTYIVYNLLNISVRDSKRIINIMHIQYIKVSDILWFYDVLKRRCIFFPVKKALKDSI